MTDEQRFSLLPFLSAPQCSHSITSPLDFHEAGVSQERGRRKSNLEVEPPPQLSLGHSGSVPSFLSPGSVKISSPGSVKRRNNQLITVSEEKNNYVIRDKINGSNHKSN